MDELDRKLYHDLNLDIEVPSKLEKVIKEELQRAKKKTTHCSFSKIAITACVSLLVTTGIVYAGKVLTNNIWKEPQKQEGFYSRKNNTTQEEKENIMSEIEARKKLDTLLKKFGHENEKITLIELINNPNDYELVWHIELENGTYHKNIVEFDAKGKKDFSVMFQDALNESVHNYRIMKKEVEKTARALCKKYGYDTEKYNKVNMLPNLETEKDSYMWYVDFYKEYDGIINPYETISIGFIPEINEIYYLREKDLAYENNPIEITEEQSKTIVIEEEQKVNTKYKIKNISTKLGIEKMNGDAYFRLTDYEQYYKEKHTENYPLNKMINYRTENLVRKVWKVKVEYDIPELMISENKEYNSFDRYYTYYVDVTTGEIIGGSSTDSI